MIDLNDSVELVESVLHQNATPITVLSGLFLPRVAKLRGH